jgi:hypothetical protein
MPGFTPSAKVCAELFWSVGHGELVGGGFEGFAFGKIFAFSGDFAIWFGAHSAVKNSSSLRVQVSSLKRMLA